MEKYLNDFAKYMDRYYGNYDFAEDADIMRDVEERRGAVMSIMIEKIYALEKKMNELQSSK